MRQKSSFQDEWFSFYGGKLQFFEKIDHFLSWKMLDIYKSKSFNKKSKNMFKSSTFLRNREESSFQGEWFSFYEGQTVIFCKKLQFFKTTIIQLRLNCVLIVENLIEFKNVYSGLCQKRAPLWSKWEKIKKSANIWDIQK